MKHQRILVTGGAGFIGSAVVRQLVEGTSAYVLNVDKLTYAGNLASLGAAKDSPHYQFCNQDICDPEAMAAAFTEFGPDAVMHLAAESHVDRSINGAAEFIQSNVVGTYTLLAAATAYWRSLDNEVRTRFRFLHVSTDEVFGSLGLTGKFSESTPYDPRSPYSASKAASDHLARAWHHTHGLPVLVTNCTNNYGPYHHPEKLVPLVILKALAGEPLPVYGDGSNVRDWLYVEDHARALVTIAEQGQIGESYNVGGHNEKTNLEVVCTICAILDAITPDAQIGAREQLITFVKDRPGHDKRYAIDATKIGQDLGWTPQETFETGLRKTVRWYLDNRSWWERIRSGVYRGERLGAGG